MVIPDENVAQVRLEPEVLILDPGNTGILTLSVGDARGLFGAEVHVSFDPAMIEVIDANTSTEGVQATLGALLSPDFVVLNRADNVASTIDIALTQVRPTLASEGDGTLLSSRFEPWVTASQLWM